MSQGLEGLFVGVRAIPEVEGGALATGEGVVVGGGDQLVLGARYDISETIDRVRPATDLVETKCLSRGRRLRRSSRWPTWSSRSERRASPSSSRWLRSSRYPNEWKLCTQMRPARSTPSAASSRSASSPAARTLYVSMRMFSGARLGSDPSRCRTRSTTTVVLPVPAPASTMSGPPPHSTARRCSSVSATRGALVSRPWIVSCNGPPSSVNRPYAPPVPTVCHDHRTHHPIIRTAR